MSEKLPQSKIEAILPVLGLIAGHIAELGEPDEDDLTDILIPAKLNKTEWALDEIRLWVTFLVRYRGQPGKQDKLERALRLRGLPEAAARLAAERVVQSPVKEYPVDAETPAPQKPDETALVLIECSTNVIAFGDIPTGVVARATVRVTGGPGHVEAPPGVSVCPRDFGPEDTAIEVTVESRSAGQVLMSNIMLRAGEHVRTVDLLGHWISPREEPATNKEDADEFKTASESEPPKIEASTTLVVDQSGSGDYTSIQAAILNSRPGGRIRVRAGTYRENLWIETPVDIEGDGSSGNVVVVADGADVVFSLASHARLAHLTLRQVGGGDWHAVDVARGTLTIDTCDLSCEGGVCVVVRTGAEPTLRNCLIHDGNDGGMSVEEGAGCYLEQCEIFANKGAGLELWTDTATVRDCKIHSGQASGVLIWGGAKGVFERCDIFANTAAGVTVVEGGDPILRECSIHDGKAGGVVLWGGRGTFERCEIYKNVRANVAIRDGGEPTLRNCRIHSGDANGVLVWEHGKGTFNECEISNNARAGVAITAGGRPTFSRCVITQNGYEAFWIYERGGGVFAGNDLRGNYRKSWDIDASSTPSVVAIENLELYATFSYSA